MFPRKFTYGSVYSAAEHTVRNGKDQINFLQLEKKKKELVVKNNSQFTTLNEFSKDIVKHLFLVINNKQVLTKKVSFTNESNLILVQEAFPNITISDFYFDTYSNDEESFVAIARKEYVDAVIKTYTDKEIAIIGIGLGNLTIKNLLNYIQPNSTITTTNSTIILNETQIDRIEKRDSEKQYFSINGLEISNYDVLSLSGILSYYTNTFLGLEDVNNQLTAIYEKKKFFSNSLSLALGFLLLILLVNFFVFNNYFSKSDRLSAELSLNKTYKDQLLSLQKEVKTKEMVLESLQSASQSKVAVYLDKIGQLVPNSILLTAINYQPIISRFKKGKEIKVDFQKIFVGGIVKDNPDFTLFIDALEKEKWVDTVTILDFSKKGTTRSSFELLISRNHE